MSDDAVLIKPLKSPIGTFLGGATAEGICLCEFGDRGGEDRILSRLQKRHRWIHRPAVLPGRGHDLDTAQVRHLAILEEQLMEYFQGKRRSFDLSLDLGGTPWQKMVWDRLLEIPYGRTVSYGGLANELGKPGASRAVGRANGDNYVAIVVPCHRVVQADGGLRGYGGGLHRKRWLLDLEAGALQLSL